MSVKDLKCTLSGKIMSIDETKSGALSILLTDASAIDEGDNVVPLKGNVSINIYCDGDKDSFVEYKRIFVETTLSSNAIFDGQGKINSYYIKDNIRYTAKGVSSSKVVRIDNEANIIEQLRLYNRELLVSSFGESRGEIAYSLLYGDASHVEDNILSNFRYTGVAHIFAVSGLHVGLIALLLSFILSKLKAKEHINFIITAVFLFVFCLMCSFSPSTVRASIMTLVLLFGRLLSRHYDPIGAISFAGIILLVISPMNLFILGFVMSFGAVFGILLLSPIFRKIKIKNGFLDKVYSLFTISLCAQIGILPAMSVFLTLPTVSILANIILIPIFSLFYGILFVSNLLVLLMPFIKFIYIIPRAFLEVIIYINYNISLLPISNIHISSLPFIPILLIYLTLFFGGRLFVAKPLVKSISTLLIGIMAILSVVVFCLPYVPRENKIWFFEEKNNVNVMLQTKNGKLYLINPDMLYCSGISKSLANMNIYSLNGVFLLKQDDYNLSYFCETISPFSPTIYTGDSGYGYITFDNNHLEHYVISSAVIDETIKAVFYSNGEETLALVIMVGNYKFAYFADASVSDENYRAFVSSNFDFRLNCAIIDKDETSFTYGLDCDKMYYQTNKLQTITF